MSPFATDSWRLNITTKLIPDLSIYPIRDYRRFLSAHLQLLNGLCNISRQLVYDSINQLLSSYLVTTHLLSPIHFQTRINSLIEQSQSNTPAMFTRLLFLIRTVNHANAIVSAYGTNFEYITPYFIDNRYPAITQPLFYDDNCSCALNSNCTTQAKFLFQRDLSKFVILKGLKIGCTPSQSFLLSTLECFYNSTCINLIQEYTNNITIENIPLPLLTNLSRFVINTTVGDIAQNLFIEEWSPTINYSIYFTECALISCSYRYIQQVDLLYTMTFLFGLLGGLTFVLKWLSPTIIYLLYKIREYYKKRTNTVAAIIDTQITQTTMELTNVYNLDRNSAPSYLFFSLFRYLF